MSSLELLAAESAWMNARIDAAIIRAQQQAKPGGKPPFINPLNPYTGHVSVLALMENEKNGYRTFPAGMGNNTR